MNIIDQKLAEIKEQDDRLNKLSDEAATVIRNVESFLTNVRIGGVGSFYIFEGGRLSWEKSNKKFRIVVRIEDEVRPWSDCKRDVKLATFQHLPGLIHLMAENAKKIADAAEAIVIPTSKLIRQALNNTEK